MYCMICSMKIPCRKLKFNRPFSFFDLSNRFPIRLWHQAMGCQFLASSIDKVKQPNLKTVHLQSSSNSRAFSIEYPIRQEGREISEAHGHYFAPAQRPSEATYAVCCVTFSYHGAPEVSGTMPKAQSVYDDGGHAIFDVNSLRSRTH